MKPHTPPAMDAPEGVWRAYIADQLAHLHACFEDKIGRADAKVESYHIQNRIAREEDRRLVLAAIEELKQEAQSSALWISAEETKRQEDALVEEGRSQERARWLGWLRHLREWGYVVLKYGSVVVASGFAGHIASRFW